MKLSFTLVWPLMAVVYIFIVLLPMAYAILRKIPSIRRENALRQKRIEAITGVPLTRLCDAVEGTLVAVSAKVVDGRKSETLLLGMLAAADDVFAQEIVLDDESGRRVLVTDSSAIRPRPLGTKVFAIGRLEGRTSTSTFRSKGELYVLMPESEGQDVIRGETKEDLLREIGPPKPYANLLVIFLLLSPLLVGLLYDVAERREKALPRAIAERIANISQVRLSDAAEGELLAVSARIVGGSEPRLPDRNSFLGDVVIDDGSERRVLVMDRSVARWRDRGARVFAVGRLEHRSSGDTSSSQGDLDVLKPWVPGLPIILGETRDGVLSQLQSNPEVLLRRWRDESRSETLQFPLD